MAGSYVDAQEVVTGVFLGSLFAGKDADFLAANDISAVINVSDAKYVPPLGVSYLHVPLRDEGDSQLLPAFIKAWPLFFDTVTRKKGVLVHCKLGRSRSAAILMMLLMRWLSMSLKDVYDAVRAARPEVRVPLLGFQLQLTEFERREHGGPNTIEDWVGAVSAADKACVRTFKRQRRGTGAH